MAAPTLPPEALSDGTITLRPLDDGDWRIEQELSRDDAVVTWTTYPAHLDEVQALVRVRRAARWLPDGRGGRWVIEREGAAHGTAGLAIHDATTVEIFYALLPAHRGRGTAARAARALAEWAGTAGYPRIMLATFYENIASQRTAERAGFVRAGFTERRHKDTPARLIEWHYDPSVAAHDTS